MIWLAAALLAGAALTPLALTLRPALSARGRREAALALHRAQLAELDRDLAEGRIARAEHHGAVLEVERRLLSAAASGEPISRAAPRGPVWVALAMVPLAAALLYLTGGSPGLPAAPLKARIAAAEQGAREEAHMVEALRTVLATLDPHSEKAREGYVLLGAAEARLGNMKQAAEDWKVALATRFDPTLAVEAAEATAEANGHVSAEAAFLFRRALAAAPTHAPWRKLAEQRLDEYERHQ
ncbi:MAG TPA: c-type cytochrome biogenesis protein CcmI [Acetobacteraceae bacterium]|nr:c-type cytochrome biogenesis protein CcmI [Acetobacteraceae bacterium]